MLQELICWMLGPSVAVLGNETFKGQALLEGC